MQVYNQLCDYAKSLDPPVVLDITTIVMSSTTGGSSDYINYCIPQQEDQVTTSIIVYA